MSFPISQLYPLLLILWGILFWCRSKVFRATILASIALHAIFLVRVTGWGSKQPEPERIISFTFVQGGENPSENPAPENLSPPPEPSTAREPAPSGTSQSDNGESSDVEKNAREPQGPPIQKDLPRIDDPSLIDFSAHPLAESYRSELRRLIRRYRAATPEILAKGAEARVRVWFNLSRDGKLNRVFVDSRIRSSDDSLNRAAVDSVIAAAAHFPAFPRNVTQPELWFDVDLDFSEEAR
jgi:outer membrane biosynthesis protein TonB